MLDKIWTTQDIFRIKHTKRFQQGYGICISNIYGWLIHCTTHIHVMRKCGFLPRGRSNTETFHQFCPFAWRGLLSFQCWEFHCSNSHPYNWELTPGLNTETLVVTIWQRSSDWCPGSCASCWLLGTCTRLSHRWWWCWWWWWWWCWCWCWWRWWWWLLRRLRLRWWLLCRWWLRGLRLWLGSVLWILWCGWLLRGITFLSRSSRFRTSTRPGSPSKRPQKVGHSDDIRNRNRLHHNKFDDEKITQKNEMVTPQRPSQGTFALLSWKHSHC